MAEDGRVLVRASGTEPLLRVMVEAADQAVVDHWTSRLAAAADQHLNAALSAAFQRQGERSIAGVSTPVVPVRLQLTLA